MKRIFVFCVLVLMSTACIQATKPKGIKPPAKSSYTPKTTMVKEDPAKFVLQEKDLPSGFNFELGWYQDLEERANRFEDPEEGRRKLLEWGYINSYINRFKINFDSPNIFTKSFVILSKVSRYKTLEGTKKAYDYQNYRFIYEDGYQRISAQDIGDEGILLKHNFRVEDSDFAAYVLSFRYQNSINSILVLGYVGTLNKDEIIGLAKIMKDRLENR